MSPESMDNVDLDIVMFVENIFGTYIPDDDAKHFGGPLGMEEWLEQHLSNQRPKEDTAELLRMLADAQQRPELAEGLDGTWRREQISALVRDIFRKRASPMELHEMLLLPPLQRFGEHRRKLGHSLVRDWRKLLPTKGSMLLFTVLLTFILLYRQFLR
ncbi:MAG: hypothetical protein LAO30_17220 [Acidobacteriia bacterium]|nr:hypothetical protein [Terriglobia bacterium]